MPEYTSSEIIAEYLIKEGVQHVFGVTGHGCTAFVDAFFDRHDKIKPIMVRHEQSAAHMADAYFRVTGRPGVCHTSLGPGATNLLTGLATAMADSSAVVALCGAPPTRDVERGVLQSMYRHREEDFANIMRLSTKRVWNVARADRTPEVIARAFKEAVTGRPGPVLVELPIDVQTEAVDIPGIPEPRQHRPIGRIRGDAKAIEHAAEILARAKRPLILAGGGVIQSGATAELVRLSEILAAPVITTMMGKGAFPESNPLFAGHAGWSGTRPGNEMAKDCDVLLAVGARFADLSCSCYKPGLTYNIPPTEVIQVDLDPLEIGKNYPVAVGIVGDAKAVLADMVKELAEASETRRFEEMPWFERLVALRKDWQKELSPSLASSSGLVTVPKFLKDLRSFLSDDAIVVGEAGWAQIFLFQQFPVYQPRTHISSGGFSTMGFAVPAAIAAKLAAPERQVVAVVGDGGFFMAMHELATAVQYNVPVVICIMNNLGWLCIRDLQKIQNCPPGQKVDRSVATMFVHGDTRGAANSEPYDVDFRAVAKAFKAYGATVKEPKEIRPALEAAFESGMPAVLNVYVDPDVTPPMPGWWALPTPEYLLRKMKR